MFQPERLATIGFAARRRPNGLVASVMWIAGMIAAVAAMAVGAVLAVFTAAALAVIAIVVHALLRIGRRTLRNGAMVSFPDEATRETRVRQVHRGRPLTIIAHDPHMPTRHAKR